MVTKVSEKCVDIFPRPTQVIRLATRPYSGPRPSWSDRGLLGFMGPLLTRDR